MTAEHPSGPVKNVRMPVFCEKITVTTNGSGNASTASGTIFGEILKVSYVKNTVNAATSAVLTFTTPATTVALDTYDVNGGSAERYPYAQPVGATDAWVPHVISNSSVTVTVTGGAASKTFDVYIYYR